VKTLKKIFPSRIPLHGWIAIGAYLIMNTIAFYGTRLFNSSKYHYDFTTRFDDMIPFIPCVIIIYSLFGFGQWIYSYYLSACEDKKTVAYIFGAEIIAKIPSAIIFILIPTTMIRPVPSGGDVFSLLVSMVYSIDTPDTLFPSFHVLESYLILRTSHLVKHAPKWYRPATLIISPLVIVSILFVKQHVIVDIFAAMAVVEFGLLVMKLYFRIRDKKNV
jgi:hypothetical protein